jgi:CRISP-associated protein Cas1
MPITRDVTLVLDGNGSYLGMEKGCFVLKDRNGNAERYPLLENQIKEVVFRSGNSVSTGALSSLGFWGVDVVVETARGRPVAMMKSFDDDRHVETRLAQYDAVRGQKGLQIAREIVRARIYSQNTVLAKRELPIHDLSIVDRKIDSLDIPDLGKMRQKLVSIEGRITKNYWGQILNLVPSKIRPKKRMKFRAFDGVNNLFNLGYEMLQWKIQRALVKAYLEPYLGFVHSVQYGKPSLVCDFEELYRYKIEEYVLDYVQELSSKDFVTKSEKAMPPRIGKRMYLNNEKTREFMNDLENVFKESVHVATVRAKGKQQRFETLINEESMLLAKYVRNEKEEWCPRITSLLS